MSLHSSENDENELNCNCEKMKTKLMVMVKTKRILVAMVKHVLTAHGTVKTVHTSLQAENFKMCCL